MLELISVSSGYADAQVLRQVSLQLNAGEIVCILGRNGAGKTTMMKTIMGLLKADAGQIMYNGTDLTTLSPHKIAGFGIGYIPQGRRLFAELTVAENLEIGLMAGGKSVATRDKVLAMFPRLAERLDQRADTLSGGEQQMLATGRALCLEPQLLLLDEPTEGLQPSMIALIRDTVVALKQQGVGILLVEQRVDAVLSIADKVMFLENGMSRDIMSADHLRKNPDLLKKYIGV
ncbi:MAG: ABC transporter ATP-binding protein [Alphaproteobacteria bacterium]|nr:ABC transporter ATP-binding protein [Alphaproteobacteria bacterium]